MVSTKTCYDKYSKYVSILLPQHTCNVETCLRLYYIAVSICCSALYTIDASHMAVYTLNELTVMHLLYGDTEDACSLHN